MNNKKSNVPFHHHQRASSWQGQGQEAKSSAASASSASTGLTMAPQHRSRSSASPILMQQSPSPQQQQQQSSQPPHQQQHSHDSSSNISAAQTRCDSVVWEGIVKATEVVVRSRCILSSLQEEDANQAGAERGDPSTTSSRTAAATTASSSTSRGSRFHLEIDHVPSIRKALVPWKKSLKVPLQLDIFYHFHSHEKQRDERILLERWCFEYQYYLEDQGTSSSTTTNRNSTTTSHSTMSDLRQVVKNLVVLLRCLLSYTRLLPAYSIHCFLSQEHSMSSLAPHPDDVYAQQQQTSSSSKSTTTFIGYAFHGAAINPTTGKYDTNDPYLIRNNFKQHEFRTLHTPFGKLVVTIWYHPLSTQIASTQLQQLKQQQQKQHSIVVGTPTTSTALPIPISTTNRKGEPLQQQQHSSSFQPSNSPSFGSTTPRNVSEFLIPDYHSPKPESFLSKRMQREEHHEQQHHHMSPSSTRNSTKHKGRDDEAKHEVEAPGNTATAPMKPSLSGLSLAMLHQDEQQQTQGNTTISRGMTMQGPDSVRRNSGTSTPLLSSSPSSFVTTRQLSNSPGPFAMLSEAVGTGIGSARSSNSHRAVGRPSSFTNRSGGNFIGSSNTNRSGTNKGVRPPSPPFGNHTQHNFNQELPSSDRSFSARMKQNSSGGSSDRNLLLSGGGGQSATVDALLLEPHNSFEKLHNSPFLSLSGAVPSSSSHLDTTTHHNASLVVTSSGMNHAAAGAGSTTNLMMNPMIGLLPRSQTSLLPLGPPHHHFNGGASSAVMGATVAPPSSSLLGLSTAGGGAGGSTTLHAGTASAFHSHISSLSFASGGGPNDYGGLEGSTVSSWKQNNKFLNPAASSSVAVWEEMPFATDEGERMMHNFGSREGHQQQDNEDGNNSTKKKVMFGSSSAVVSTPAILSFSKQCSLASHLSLLEKDGGADHNIDGTPGSSNHRMTFLSSSSLSPQEESQHQAEQLASFKQFAATLKLN